MWRGFRFGLGFAVAAALVYGVVQFGDFYGRCTSAIDSAGMPPAGHACEWVASIHPPKDLSLP